MKNTNNVGTIQGERPLLDQTRVNSLIKNKNTNKYWQKEGVNKFTIHLTMASLGKESPETTLKEIEMKKIIRNNTISIINKFHNWNFVTKFYQES